MIPFDTHTNEQIVISNPQPYVGCYAVGGIEFWLNHKPSIVERWFVRRLLGWSWKDR